MTLSDYSGRVVGRYHITSPLSSGATSSVYSAIHTERHEKYAIKCICKLDLTPKQHLLRVSEIFHHQLVTGCSPHILSLQEIIDEDSYLFIVFPLCEGDLFQAIWDQRLFLRNDALVKETFLAILDGVYACHTRGVFHRDLKPENILCVEGGTDVQIADFGLATRKRIWRGSRCGTPDYMSPEQWSDRIVYYPSLNDIWSLGIILLNMVTGRRPWKAARESDVHFRAFLDDEDYLYNTFPISRALGDLLKWILHPNPMGRLQIPQIWHAISNMDTFYRRPGSPSENTTAIGWSKEVATTREEQFCRRLCKPKSIAKQNRKQNAQTSFPPPIKDCMIHEQLNSEELAGV